MPNCYALTKIGESKYTKLATVDDQMREYFDAPPNPDEWYKNWEMYLGLAFSLGKDFDDCRTIFPDLKDVIDWIENNYTVTAWYQR